jgi:hypothetical protein
MYQPPDGRKRSREDEQRLNEAFAITFAGERGEFVLNYLKHVTLNAVAGPGVDPNHLMHLEGQRFVVGLIDQRIRYGRDKEPKESTRGKSS